MILTETTDQKDLPRYFQAVFQLARGLHRGRLDFVLPDGRVFRAEAPRPGPVERALPWSPGAAARGAAPVPPPAAAGVPTLAGPSGRVLVGPSTPPPSQSPAPRAGRVSLRQRTLLKSALGVSRPDEAPAGPGRPPPGSAAMAGRPPRAAGGGAAPTAAPGARVLERRRWHEQALSRLEGLYRRDQGRELAQSHRRAGLARSHASPKERSRGGAKRRGGQWGGGADKRGNVGGGGGHGGRRR